MLPIVPVVVIVAAGGWYVWSAKVRRTPWAHSRVTALVMMELLLLIGSGVALGSTRTAFVAYTFQQIFIGMAAPLFLVLALPRLPSGRLVSNPVAAWFVYAASLFVLYFTGFYSTSLHNPLVLQGVYLMWLAAGVVYYMPVANERFRYWPRILYLLLAFPLWAIFGMALGSEGTTIAAGVRLVDLQVGAAILWVAGETVVLLGAVAIFVQWLRADEKTARAKDRTSEEAAARQLALWRAARDAAARAS